MNTVEIKCAFCETRFERKAGQYREAVKFGWKQYCSFKCRDKAKILAKEFKCGNPKCEKKFMRIPSEIRKGKVEKMFCSHTCAAIVNNKLRIKFSKCANCGKIIRSCNKYCTFECSSNKRRRPIEQTREDVLKRLKIFYQANQRIPVKREIPGLYKTARVAYGTWNKAIKQAGFDPNPLLFAKKFIAKDGHICDSFTEKIIDDWLFNNKIKHERNFPYKDTKYTADFRVSPKVFVEFFGLAGVQKNYDKVIERKREECRKANIKLIEIYPKDVYPKNTLPKILEKLF